MAARVSQAIRLAAPDYSNFSKLLPFHQIGIPRSNDSLSYRKSSRRVWADDQPQQRFQPKRYWLVHYLHRISQHLQGINLNIFASQHRQSAYRWSKSISQSFTLLRLFRLRYLERISLHSLQRTNCLDGIATGEDQQQ